MFVRRYRDWDQLGLASGLRLSGAIESAGAALSVGRGASVGALLAPVVLLHAPRRTAAPRMRIARTDFKTCSSAGLSGGLDYPTGGAGALRATPTDEGVAAA